MAEKTNSSVLRLQSVGSISLGTRPGKASWQRAGQSRAARLMVAGKQREQDREQRGPLCPGLCSLQPGPTSVRWPTCQGFPGHLPQTPPCFPVSSASLNHHRGTKNLTEGRLSHGGWKSTEYVPFPEPTGMEDVLCFSRSCQVLADSTSPAPSSL